VDLDDLAQSISALSDHAVVTRPIEIIHDWVHVDMIVLYIIIAALTLGFIVGRHRSHRRLRGYRASAFQNYGEALLSSVALTNFRPPDYHLMNHVTLQLKDGTTQIDHILVSRFGVFVIETKDYKGWIFADANRANWTQVLFYRKFKFQNPLFQNFRHVRAVEDLLDFLPRGAVKSVVVFTGEAEFKTKMPQGVVRLHDFIEYIRDQTVELMSLNRLQFCVGRLETARLAISGETDIEHVQSLQRRH